MKSTLSISSLSRQVLLRETRDYLMIALGMILYGIGWTVFLLPNDITTGGVPGIASIVFWATGFPVQYTYFLINAVLLMLALKILGFKFSIKTIFAVFTLTFFLRKHALFPVRRNSRTGIKLCRRFPFGRNAFLRRLCIQWGGRFADHVCRLTVRSYRIPAGISGLLPTQFIKCRHSGMESNSHQYCGCHQRKIILQLI